jgi:hypothetical protein
VSAELQLRRSHKTASALISSGRQPLGKQVLRPVAFANHGRAPGISPGVASNR